MAKSVSKKWSKEVATIKEQNSFLESMSIRMYAFWAVVVILSLIIVISAFAAIMTHGNERKLISVPSPQLGMKAQRGMRFLAIPSKKKAPITEMSPGKKEEIVNSDILIDRKFERSHTETDALASSAVDSCNCNYDSEVGWIDITHILYRVYPNTSTNWTCALVCCEQSSSRRASLANLSDINPDILQQFPYEYSGMPVSYWTANSCNYSEIQGHVMIIRKAQAIDFPCTPDRITMRPLCQVDLSKPEMKHTSYMPISTEKPDWSKHSTEPSHFSRTLMVTTQLVDCSSAMCQSETSTGCSLDGHKCVCMAGWQGIACQRSIDHCSDHQCRFGQCINHNDTYLCKCLSGYGGQKCDMAVGRSTDPMQVYSAVAQGLGSTWVLISAGVSFIVLTALREISPLACLSRHFLVALFCEHLMIALFHFPTVMSINQPVCHWISLVILYFHGVHLILTLFLTYHIHYIMTGVTSGQWGWNGDWRIFECLAWGSPILACLAIWAVSFQDLATGFTCMMNWETHGIRWFMIMLLLMLLSLNSLEQAHSEMDFQKKCTSFLVDSVQLRGAQITLCGMYFLIFLAPMSYVVCSYAVFTGSPYYFSLGCGCNIALGIMLLITFVITNQYAWILLVKWFHAIQKRVVGKTKDPNATDMHNYTS